MRRLIPLLLALAACGGGEQPAQPLSRTPVSVRGWIADVEGAPTGELQTPETEGARLAELFQATSMWIEDAPYVSGGVAPNGAFILLDVPPGDVTISFSAPGAEDAQLTLQNIPGNADLLIPAVLLTRGGSKLLQPDQVVVRVPARVPAPRRTGQVATVAGVPLPVIEAPLGDFTDRRDYPERGIRPLAIVRDEQ
ncbi:MAG TPA: hypothetical protein VNA04_14945 [Thermoanaerobaculia bacterium]|nr:hypothetical protein [Thermoanaerobaculia bacterium]